MIFWGSSNPSQHVDRRMLRILIVPFLFIDNQIFDQVVFLQPQRKVEGLARFWAVPLERRVGLNVFANMMLHGCQLLNRSNQTPGSRC